jgi:hypothetical protein
MDFIQISSQQRAFGRRENPKRICSLINGLFLFHNSAVASRSQKLARTKFQVKFITQLQTISQIWVKNKRAKALPQKR